MNKRVGVYLRVSTSEQSTDLQKEEILSYLKARGLGTDIVIYEDHGVSGTTADRPALKEMLSHAKDRKLDLVIAWKLDRLFRSLQDLVRTLHEFKELGVSFISLKDQIDLDTASGRLMMHMIGAFSEFEASLIKERVKAGIKSARDKGKTLGRPRTNKECLIRSFRAKGFTYAKIQQELNVSAGTIRRALISESK